MAWNLLENVTDFEKNLVLWHAQALTLSWEKRLGLYSVNTFCGLGAKVRCTHQQRYICAAFSKPAIFRAFRACIHAEAKHTYALARIVPWALVSITHIYLVGRKLRARFNERSASSKTASAHETPTEGFALCEGNSGPPGRPLLTSWKLHFSSQHKLTTTTAHFTLCPIITRAMLELHASAYYCAFLDRFSRLL